LKHKATACLVALSDSTNAVRRWALIHGDAGVAVTQAWGHAATATRTAVSW